MSRFALFIGPAILVALSFVFMGTEGGIARIMHQTHAQAA